MARTFVICVGWVFCVDFLLAVGKTLSGGRVHADPVFEIKSHGYVSVFPTRGEAITFAFKNYGADYYKRTLTIDGVWIMNVNSHYRTPTKDGILPITVSFFWLPSSGCARNGREYGGSEYNELEINLKDIEPCLPLIEQDHRVICQAPHRQPGPEPQAFIINFFEITEYSFKEAAPGIHLYLFNSYKAAFLYTNFQYCKSVVQTMNAQGVEINSYWRIKLYHQYLMAKFAVYHADAVIDELEAEVARLNDHLPAFYYSFLCELSSSIERRVVPFEKLKSGLVDYPEPKKLRRSVTIFPEPFHSFRSRMRSYPRVSCSS